MTAKSRAGRPPYEPTEEAREKVRVLKAGGMSDVAVASALCISVPTLTKHHSLELEEGAARVQADVLMARYRAAMGGNVPAQNKLLDQIGMVPQRNGMRVWQPRFDSTYPGGSGPQRRDDWRTWGWSENPYDHALAWVRGHYKLNIDGSIDKTKRIAGVGAPDSAIDIPAFVEGANISDANGWTISGEWSTSDGKWQTLVAMLQAGGGQPINRGAQISVLVNAPRVSTYTYTKADLVGQAQIKPLTPRRDRKNTIIPRYRSQANGWEYVAAGEVTSSTYRTEDRGEQRSTEVEYVHVRDARQAGQLAAYDLVTLREGLTATLPSKVHLLNVHAGDCITVNEPELAMVNQKFVVMRTTTDYKSAVVTLELRSETDAKHAFALGQTDQAPPSPALSAVDPRYIDPPIGDDWGASPKPPVDGISQPVIVIGGKVETGDIASIIVEVGKSEAGPWTMVYSGVPLLDGRYEAKGLDPLADYWMSIRYVAKNGAISDRLVKGPLKAPNLTAGVGEDVVNKIRDDLKAILDGSAEAEKVAEVLLETIMNERDSLEAEASQRIEDLLNEAGARDKAVALAITESKTYVDDFKSESMMTFATINALNGGLAATLIEAQSYTTGSVSSAMLTVYTKAQTDAGLASTLQTSRSYTDTYKSEAQLLFSTKAERANGDASAVIEAKSYVDAYKAEASLSFPTKAQLNSAIASTLIDSKSYSDGKLAEALTTIYTKAETDAGRASSLIEAKSYTDALQSYSTLNFSTKAELNGVSGQAALALSTAVGADGKIKAKVGLATQVGNLISGIENENNGVVASVKILSSIFQLLSTSSSDRAEFADGIWYFYDGAGTARAMVGRPFGGSHKLILWCGPASVSLGGESKDNAYVYVSMNTVGGGRFGGSDVAGGAAPLAATTSSEVASGSKPGGGYVNTNTITINVTGQGAASAIVRWVKTTETGGTVDVYPTGRQASFQGYVAPGGLTRATYLAVVTVPGGASVTVVQDVQLTDSN